MPLLLAGLWSSIFPAPSTGQQPIEFARERVAVFLSGDAIAVDGNYVLRNPSPRDVVQIPIWGRIVAGEPLPVPEDNAFPDETVDIAVGMLGDTSDVYALEVEGNSMVDALINSGDVVLMKRQTTARNGDMVAALLRGEETTLKRFYLEGNRVRLQPANPTMDPIYAPARDVEIQGKVIMVIRRLN